ncbi:MAG: thiL, partial [Rhodospirillaceae bacterium]
MLDPPAGCSVVVTADAITAGVHFRSEDPPDLIARKLIRVNLSDLAAMGARPWAMVMTAAFPDSADDAWIDRFANGLRADGQHFGLPLIGGDTIATPGPATFSLTAFGLVAQGQALRRDGARAGDHLYVTGTVGDGALGLQVLTGRLSFTHAGPAFASHLVSRYHLPQPRLAAGIGLVGKATACVDISDGLL